MSPPLLTTTQDFLTDTDFLASSLWPNNPSLHPPILYGLFKDWDGDAIATAFPSYHPSLVKDWDGDAIAMPYPPRRSRRYLVITPPRRGALRPGDGAQ